MTDMVGGILVCFLLQAPSESKADLRFISKRTNWVCVRLVGCIVSAKQFLFIKKHIKIQSLFAIKFFVKKENSYFALLRVIQWYAGDTPNLSWVPLYLKE